MRSGTAYGAGMPVWSRGWWFVVASCVVAVTPIAGCSLFVETSGLVGEADGGAGVVQANPEGGAAEGGGGGVDAGDASGGQDAGADGSKAVPIFLQGVGGLVGANTTLSLALTPTQAGSLVVVGMGQSFGASAPVVASVTDNAPGGSNTYVSANARSVHTNDGNAAEIWYAKGGRAGATSVTITLTAVPQQITGWAMEFSGLSATDPLDAVAVASDQSSTSAVAAPNVNTSGPDEVVVSVAVVIDVVQGIVPGNPFVALPVQNGDDTAYFVARTPGTYGAVWKSPGAMTWCSSTAAFR